MINQPYILVVTGDEDFRKSLCDALTFRRYHVLPAEDGTEALDLASSHMPDLAVLDTHMPGTGWRAFYEKICDRNGIPLFPVFVLTGDEDLPAGYLVEGFMRKPSCLDPLLERVEVILQRDK